MMHASSGARDDALSLSGAAFGYGGRTRVEGLTLEVPEGSAVALVGPNGSGKSTLLRGILGLADLTAGGARVLGEAPGRARPRIGSLPQADTRDAALPVTLRQVVTMGLYRSRGALRPIGRAGRAAVARSLERVGLAELAGRRFGELSGGQQQRGILARALVSGPRMLLLDEPFNGLDGENREALLRLVRELRDEGRTVVVSTHDPEISRRVCTHALRLRSGRRPGEPGRPAAFGPLAEALALGGTTPEPRTTATVREAE